MHRNPSTHVYKVMNKTKDIQLAEEFSRGRTGLRVGITWSVKDKSKGSRSTLFDRHGEYFFEYDRAKSVVNVYDDGVNTGISISVSSEDMAAAETAAWLANRLAKRYGLDVEA